MSSMIRDSFVFDGRPDYPFRLSVNRYRHPHFSCPHDDAVTLIVTHCLGGHKEQWEPTLECLFGLSKGNPTLKIYEAWSIDGPEHGESALLNDHLLTQTMDWRPESTFSWEEYARGIHSFVCGLGTGIDVDFRPRRLVGLGHSFGGTALLLSTAYSPKIKFTSMILIEPMIIRMPKPGESRLDFSDATLKRQDIWDSREDALRFFKSAKMWKGWDSRVLQIHADHGLTDLPNTTYPGRKGVTLKCAKRYEAALFRDRLSSLRAFDYLHVVCQRIPVHLIHPEHADFIPKSFLKDIPTLASRGLHASLRTIPGAAHLVVQTHPERAAEAIAAALVCGDTRPDSKEANMFAKL